MQYYNLHAEQNLIDYNEFSKRVTQKSVKQDSNNLLKNGAIAIGL
jgi:hypothetical protein